MDRQMSDELNDSKEERRIANVVTLTDLIASGLSRDEIIEMRKTNTTPTTQDQLKAHMGARGKS